MQIECKIIIHTIRRLPYIIGILVIFSSMLLIAVSLLDFGFVTLLANFSCPFYYSREYSETVHFPYCIVLFPICFYYTVTFYHFVILITYCFVAMIHCYVDEADMLFGV
jgi:hypothetical protein